MASRCMRLITAMSPAARSSSAARARTRRSQRLDGNVRNLQPDMLVIADETKPVGLAGIMGGENSEIVSDTVDVVFESANFLGSSIRKTALALGMRTDASAKFEKDIDPMLTRSGRQPRLRARRAAWCGRGHGRHHRHASTMFPQPVTLPLEPAKINALLGTDISEADMIEYLRREEVPVVDGQIQVPSWRPDLSLHGRYRRGSRAVLWIQQHPKPRSCAARRRAAATLRRRCCENQRRRCGQKPRLQRDHHLFLRLPRFV